MPEKHAKIVLVGHCVPDVFALRSSIAWAVEGAEVVTANDTASADAAAGEADLLLVNRVLDGRFGRESGMELVGRYAAAGRPVMLVSNFEASQTEAEAAGALPGFGKGDLNTELMKDRLASALARV